MIKKIYLDINIIIDLVDITRPTHKDSQSLIRYALINEISIVISEDMISTIFYIVKDKQSVLKFLKVIVEEWQIVSFGQDVINDAIDTSIASGCDLEDIMQCLCAKKHSCDILITNDKDFYSCGVECMNTSKFLEKLKIS
jgi:predicted nucleic acid-binding protein